MSLARVIHVTARLCRLPLDFILLTWDTLLGLRMAGKTLLKRKRQPCPYCCRLPNPEFPRPCTAADKYGNWWMLKAACPCLRGPSAELGTPHCNRRNPKKWSAAWIPCALLVVGSVWTGVGVLGMKSGRFAMAFRADPPAPRYAPPENPGEPDPAGGEAKTLEALLEKGRSLYDQERYASARIAFLNAAKAYPTNAVCQLELGRCLVMQNQFQLAMNHFRRAVEMEPELKEPHLEMADLYFFGSQHEQVVEHLEKARGSWEDHVERRLNLAQSHYALQDLDAAGSELDAVLKLWESQAPKSGDLIRAAHLLALMDKPDRAKQTMLDAVKRYPDDYDSHIGLCSVLLSQGALEDAGQALNKAEELDPGRIEAEIQRLDLDLLATGVNAGIEGYQAFIARHPSRNDVKQRLAEILIQARRFDDAMQVADELASAINRRDSLEGLRIRARICFYKSMFTDAISSARKALAEDPHDPNTLMILGKSLFAQRKYQPALAELEKVQAAAPRMLLPGLLIARCHGLLGNMDQSREAFTECVRRFPDSDTALLELANFLYVENDHEKARACYEKLLERSPGHLPAANNLAQILADMQQDLDQAYALANDLQTRFPKHPQYEDLLGWVLFRQGKPDEALPRLHKAAKQLPNAPSARYHYGAALLAAGKKEEARLELQAALDLRLRFTGEDQAREMLAGLATAKAPEPPEP